MTQGRMRSQLRLGKTGTQVSCVHRRSCRRGEWPRADRGGAWFATAFESLGAHRYIAAHAVASGLSVVVLTYFHIVVGEMVAKSLALQQAERTVLSVAPLMRIVRLCFVDGRVPDSIDVPDS